MKKKKQYLLPEIIAYPFRILSIDPGTNYLGWSILEIWPDHSSFIGYGTIYGKGHDTKRTSNIVDELLEIMGKHLPDICTIEDYAFIRKKTKGMYKVPALIGVISYIWYTFANSDPIMIPSSTWKQVICGNGKAQKEDIVRSMKTILPPEIIKEIESRYKKVRGKHIGDMGEQDCYDAVGQNVYIAKHLVAEISQRTEDIINL